jgi:hypothetical protein
VGRNVVGNNHSSNAGITSAVALTDRGKKPQKSQSRQSLGGLPGTRVRVMVSGRRSAQLPCSVNESTDRRVVRENMRRKTILYSSQLSSRLRLQARIMGNDVLRTSVPIHQWSTPWKHGRGEAVFLHSFLIYALDEGVPTSCPERCIAGKEPPGGYVDPRMGLDVSWTRKSLASAGTRTPDRQPVA